MSNLQDLSKIDSSEQYIIARYECSTKHNGTKGQLLAIDLGLVYEPQDNGPVFIDYKDILNIQKIERGHTTYHRLMFHLYPLLLVVAFFLWVDNTNDLIPKVLLFSFFPLILSGRYFIHYLNYLQFDYAIDRHQLAEAKFKLRFIDMVFMYGIIRQQQARVHSEIYCPLSTRLSN